MTGLGYGHDIDICLRWVYSESVLLLATSGGPVVLVSFGGVWKSTTATVAQVLHFQIACLFSVIQLNGV